MTVVLIVDEASLMRLEVFAELHTICQFEKDSKPYLPMILAGQNNLVDKLSYRSSQPLASRIVARSHLQATSLDGMKTYLKHHLAIAGVEHNLFDQAAFTAIHQGSGGLFRKANHLARGALIAAAASNKSMVDAEHVQLASTEILLKKELAMQQHPTIQDVADHFEHLLIRIMLAAISQLIDEIAGFKDGNEVEFWSFR